MKRLFRETIHVTRVEANFDRACDEAWQRAKVIAGVDQDGHFRNVPGAARNDSCLAIKLIGYRCHGGMGGIRHCYTFLVTVEKADA